MHRLGALRRPGATRRIGAAAAAFLATAALLGGIARAGVEWCAEDPVFTILGAQLSVTTTVGAPASSVSGIAYVLEVPANAGTVTVEYPGGTPIATTVQIRYTEPVYRRGGSFPVRLTTTVASARATWVRVNATADGADATTVRGATTRPLTFETDIQPD